MNILIACEESQRVCSAFRAKGHNAFSCDILPCSGGRPEWHIMHDVVPLLNGFVAFHTADGVYHDDVLCCEWDMIIAFPPCTYLSKAGACRLYPSKGIIDPERFEKGIEAKNLFMAILNADCPRIAIENPVSLRVFQLPKHTQSFHPYQFDPLGVHPYTKHTRLWLRGLPLLIPTSPNAIPVCPYVPSYTSRKLRSKYGSAKRGFDSINRSKTFVGVAEAMSDQWG